MNYLSLPAVETGLKFLRSIGLPLIHRRIMALTGWLLDNLVELRHGNGHPVVELYGPKTTHDRGGTIAFNLHDPGGRMFDFHMVEQAASQAGISLRTGCFCNPGAGEIAFGLTKNDMRECFGNEERTSFEQCIVAIKGKTAGAVRVSLGLVTNFNDVYRFMEFVRSFIDKPASP